MSEQKWKWGDALAYKPLSIERKKELEDSFLTVINIAVNGTNESKEKVSDIPATTESDRLEWAKQDEYRNQVLNFAGSKPFLFRIQRNKKWYHFKTIY